MFYVVFEKETGSIKRCGRTNDISSVEHEVTFSPSDSFLEVDSLIDEHLFYVKKDGLEASCIERPRFNLPSSVEIRHGESLFLDIPSETRIRIDSDLIGTSNGKQVEITGDMPGFYEIYLEKWPFVSHKIEVTVNED